MLELCFLLSGNVHSGSLLSAGVLSSLMQTANAAKPGKDLAEPQTDGRALDSEASQLQILVEYLGLPILFAYLDVAGAAGQHVGFLVGAWVPPPRLLRLSAMIESGNYSSQESGARSVETVDYIGG